MDISLRTTRSLHLPAVAALCAFLAGCGGGGGGGPNAAPDSDQLTQDWNVVLILTDDQRWDTWQAMPNLAAIVEAEGARLPNAYMTSPVCGPSRASLLSGGHYAQDTGILTNPAINGGWAAFDEEVSLARRLRGAGYVTGFSGKYMNGYDQIELGEAGIVPAGWDFFVADSPDKTGDGDWYSNSYLKLDRSSMSRPSGGLATDYLTDFETSNAVEFIDAHGQEKFFLHVSYHAPHFPAIPEPEDETAFQGFSYSGRAFGEPDLSDKPAMAIERLSDNFAEEGPRRQEFARNQLRTVLSIDRGVQEIFAAIERQGVADRTAVFFVSDNGLLWGEHQLWGKSKAYEEAIRVPMAAVIPGRKARATDRLISASLDIPATILDIANQPNTGSGISLLPALLGSAAATPPAQQQLYFENFALGNGAPYVWVSTLLKTPESSWKYTAYQTGEFELYDLVRDPFEEQNIAGEADVADIEAQLARDLERFRAVAILDRELPVARQGQPYDHQLASWGVEGTATFVITDGELPPGLAINSASGRITGVPEEAGQYSFTVTLSGEQLALYTGQPMQHRVAFVMDVGDL